MIISVNWLQKYLNQTVDIETLTQRIGSRLVEIESVTPLADKYRDPVLLKYIWHLSYQEIATQLDLPLTTIETRLFRGRHMLKEKLSTYIK